MQRIFDRGSVTAGEIGVLHARDPIWRNWVSPRYTPTYYSSTAQVAMLRLI